MKNLFKTAVKWGPVVYPVVRKILGNRKAKASMPTRRR
ncbi:MAG: hypothetical protein ACI33P_12400 [Lysinibacillus sp.]